MRLTNRNKAGMYNFVSSVVFMLLFGGIVLFLLEHFKYDYLGASEYLLLLVPLFILVLFYARGKQIFEYDSDGEALNFKNRDIIPFISKPVSDEFPKYKLLHFEVVDIFILSRLYIKIYSNKGNSVTLKYDVSYLTKKEMNDLKFSLSKVVKENQENKREKIS